MARAYNHPPETTPLSPLCTQLQNDCCSSLLGTEEKRSIIKQITALEDSAKSAASTISFLKQQRRDLGAVIDRLHREIAKLEQEGKSVMKATFDVSYTGTDANRDTAWQQLLLELGI